MDKIDLKLYELFADKTLSYGCKFLIQNELYSYVYCEWNENMLIDDMWYAKWRDDWEHDSYLLWHEPQLHDVFRVAKEKLFHYWIWLQCRWEYILSIYWNDNHLYVP
jgi:hypothetical protein